MVALVIVSSLILFLLRIIPSTSVPQSINLSLGEIRGMAVTEKELPYTLNFSQEKRADAALHHSVFVEKKDYPSIKGPFSFQKITIYLFEKEPLEIFPVEIVNKNLVFSMPGISTDRYFLELSGGDFLHMIQESIDQFSPSPSS